MDDNFKREFDRFRLEALAYIQARAPRRTGNLKANIRYQKTPKGFEIIIDIDYMKYTEEAWISPRWNGRENPNLYWLRESVKRLAEKFANKLGGTVR